MFTGTQIALMLLLGVIAWQDWKTRSVNLWVLLTAILMCGVVWTVSENSSMNQLKTSFGVLLTTMILVALYIIVRFGKNGIKTVGAGDILLVLSLPFLLPEMYTLFFLGTTALLGAGFTLALRWKTVPYCSFVGIGLAVISSIRLFHPQFLWQ